MSQQNDTNVDDRFQRWLVFTKAATEDYIRKHETANPDHIMLHDKSDTDEVDPPIYPITFSDASTGLQTYHQMLLERSLFQLFMRQNGNQAADDPIGLPLAVVDPFKESHLRKMCSFLEDDNVEFNQDFGKIINHVQCLKDVSLVRYVRAHQKYTNQCLLIRMDAYISDDDGDELLSLFGSDPMIRSDHSDQHLVRHFHSWKDTATIQDPFRNCGNVTICFVCSATAAPTRSLEGFIRSETLTVSSALEICSQIAELADMLHKGFYDHEGTFISYEIGPIFLCNIFLDFPSDYEEEVGLVQVANLQYSSRRDRPPGLEAPEFQNAAHHVGSLILTLTLLLCSSKEITLMRAEAIASCVTLNVIGDVKKTDASGLWELFMSVILNLDEVVHLLKGIFRSYPNSVRLHEIATAIELLKYVETKPVELGKLNESFCQELTEVYESTVKHFKENHFHCVRNEEPIGNESGFFLILKVLVDLACTLPVVVKLATDRIVSQCFISIVPIDGRKEILPETLGKLDDIYWDGVHHFEENLGKLLDQICYLSKIYLPDSSGMDWRSHMVPIWVCISPYLLAVEMMVKKLDVHFSNSADTMRKFDAFYLGDFPETLNSLQNSAMYLPHLTQNIQRQRSKSTPFCESVDDPFTLDILEPTFEACNFLATIFLAVNQKMEECCRRNVVSKIT